MPSLKSPTAVQVEVHETPVRSFDSASLAFGLGTIDHVDPYHCSIRVRCKPRPLTLALKLPTAVQAEAAVHETPVRSFDWVSLVFGLGTIDQVTPFHCSMRVF